MTRSVRSPGPATQIRMTPEGCPYVTDVDGEVIRLAELQEGHPDDDLPFGEDFTEEEMESWPPN